MTALVTIFRILEILARATAVYYHYLLFPKQPISPICIISTLTMEAVCSYKTWEILSTMSGPKIKNHRKQEKFRKKILQLTIRLDNITRNLKLYLENM
jgi:hypothetical protein